jgi:hypothetical protein
MEGRNERKKRVPLRMWFCDDEAAGGVILFQHRKSTNDVFQNLRNCKTQIEQTSLWLMSNGALTDRILLMWLASRPF